MNIIHTFLHRRINILRIRWKHRKTLDAFAKQIEEARKKHRAVRHIEAARRAYMHDCLRGGR